jgi:hypothetical protein
MTCWLTWSLEGRRPYIYRLDSHIHIHIRLRIYIRLHIRLHWYEPLSWGISSYTNCISNGFEAYDVRTQVNRQQKLLNDELIDLSRRDTKTVYVQSTICVRVCTVWYETHNPGPDAYPHTVTSLHSHTRLQTMLRLQMMLRLTCNTPPSCYAPWSKKTNLGFHSSLLKTLREQGKSTTVAWGWPSIYTKKIHISKKEKP